ncbi:hypothetical protein ACI2K4_07450 [Micromonospora sp. NPDC050397]|uniref:hypothetical protein n=1 Tax=Micromonospora sp. NPDC050397 TaxID=3364279 RepID=UPI00384C4CFC
MSNLPPETDPDQDPRSGALLRSYRDTAHEAVALPPASWIATTARHRTRRRTTVGASLSVVLVAASGSLLTWQAAANRPQPAPPLPTPSVSATGTPSPSPSSSPPSGTPSTTPSGSAAPGSAGRTSQSGITDIRQVDWSRTTIKLPADPGDSDCPTGRFTSRGERTEIGSRWIFVERKALAHGDLDRDGQVEAVLAFTCGVTSLDGGDGSGQLLVVTLRDGELVGLDYVGPPGQDYGPVKVSGGILTATISQRYQANPVPQQRGYRWNGTRFVQVSGPTAFPEPTG